MAHDIAGGRKHLNFLEWDNYSLERKWRKMDEPLEEIQQGEIPLWADILMHRDTILSTEEVGMLRKEIKMQYGPRKAHEKQEEEHHDG